MFDDAPTRRSTSLIHYWLALPASWTGTNFDPTIPLPVMMARLQAWIPARTIVDLPRLRRRMNRDATCTPRPSRTELLRAA